MKVLAFCESVHATGSSPWHLRWLDERVTSGWDLSVAITAHHLENNACWRCLAALAK